MVAPNLFLHKLLPEGLCADAPLAVYTRTGCYYHKAINYSGLQVVARVNLAYRRSKHFTHEFYYLISQCFDLWLSDYASLLLQLDNRTCNPLYTSLVENAVYTTTMEGYILLVMYSCHCTMSCVVASITSTFNVIYKYACYA